MVGKLGSRDYIVTAAEREATGKTSVEIVRDRERRKRRDTVDTDPAPAKATPGAQLVLSGLSSTTPGFEQFHGEEAETEAQQNYQESLITERERQARERPNERQVFDTVESKRDIKPVLFTAKAKAIFDRLPLEEQQKRTRLDEVYYEVGRGTRLSPSARYYRTREDDEPKQAEELDPGPAIKQYIFTQNKRSGAVDDEGVPLSVAAETEAQLIADESRRRATERGARRDVERGYITPATFGVLLRQNNYERNLFNKQQEQLQRQAIKQEKAQMKQQERDVKGYYAYKEQREAEKTPEDIAFDRAYTLSQDYDMLARQRGRESKENLEWFSTLQQYGGHPSPFLGLTELGYNWVTKGSPVLPYDERTNIFGGKTISQVYARGGETVQNLQFLGQKAIYEQEIKAYSRQADASSSMKNQLEGRYAPITPGTAESKAFVGVFNPTTPKGQATWISIGLGTAMLGTRFKITRTSAPKPPPNFSQTHQRIIWGRVKASDKFMSIDPRGFDKVPATQILKAFKGGKHAQVNIGLDIKRPVGFFRYGEKGHYTRGDFIDIRTGRNYAFSTEKGLWGGEKRSFITYSEGKNNMLNITTRVSRTRTITGRRFDYPTREYSIKSPDYNLQNYHSGQFGLSQDYKISTTPGREGWPFFKTSKSSPQFKLIHQDITAKNVSFKVTYPKNFWTKQVIETKHSVNIFSQSQSQATPVVNTLFQKSLIQSTSRVPFKPFYQIQANKIIKTTYSPTDIEVGKLTFPQDKVHLVGSKSWPQSNIKYRADSVFFNQITDKRLIRTVNVGAEQTGHTTYYTQSRIPDYLNIVKNKYLNLRYNTKIDVKLPTTTRYSMLGHKGGSIGRAGTGRIQPLFEVQLQSPSLTGARAGVLTAPVMKSAGYIVPNFPMAGLLDIGGVLPSARGLPVIIPPSTALAGANPILDSHTTPLSVARPGYATLPLVESLFNSRAQTTGISSTQPLVRTGVLSEITTGIKEAPATRLGLQTLPGLTTINTPFFGGGPTGTPPPPGDFPGFPIIPPFPFPQGGSGSKGRGARYGKKYRPKYASSLLAFDLNIKADKYFNPKRFVGLGVGVRPLI